MDSGAPAQAPRQAPLGGLCILRCQVPGAEPLEQLFIGSCHAHPSLCEVVMRVPDWWLLSDVERDELGGTEITSL